MILLTSIRLSATSGVHVNERTKLVAKISVSVERHLAFVLHTRSVSFHIQKDSGLGIPLASSVRTWKIFGTPKSICDAAKHNGRHDRHDFGSYAPIKND